MANLRSLGLQSGVNFSSYETTPDVNADVAPGWIFGAQAQWQWSENWLLQPEIRWVQKKLSYVGDSPTGATLDLDASANYLELVLLAQVRWNLAGMRPFLFFGPNLGFRTGDSVRVKLNGVEVSNSNLSLAYTSTDFALDVGGGADIPISESIEFFFMLRGSIGWVDVTKSQSLNYRSRGLQLLAGIHFLVGSENKPGRRLRTKSGSKSGPSNGLSNGEDQ